MLPLSPARSIDEVVFALDGIVEDCRQRPCRLGLFAALYRRVTVEVKARLDKGQFQDPGRMERLDTVFANRYLEAYAAHRRGDTPTRAWHAAFAASGDGSLSVLHHLLLGMNAHILLDLGVTTAQIARHHGTAGLKHDFEAINTVLADLVDEIQAGVGHDSPILRTLDWLGGGLDERALGYALATARARAWRHSLVLRSTPERFQANVIARIDQQVARVAARICVAPFRAGTSAAPEEGRSSVRGLIDRLA